MTQWPINDLLPLPLQFVRTFEVRYCAWSAGKRKGSSDTCETTSLGKKNIYPEGPQKNYAIRKPLTKVYLHRGRHWLTLLKQTSRSSKDLWPPLSSFDYHYPKAILILLVSDESTSTINKRQADSKGMRRNMEFILLSDIYWVERGFKAKYHGHQSTKIWRQFSLLLQCCSFFSIFFVCLLDWFAWCLLVRLFPIKCNRIIDCLSSI